MNLKLLAGLAIVAVLMGVGSQTFVHSVFADSNQNRAQAKAIAEKAGQEQVLIQEEMQAKDHAHAQIKS
jgi:Tfp pilus assembly protein PilE